MSEKIVVSGATGFLGRHLIPVLEGRYGAESVIGLSSRDYDLMNPEQVKRMFSDHKPDVLIHLAAYSGGIGANSAYPADFYYRNTLLTALMFQEAALNKVRKIIYPMGGCSYPATARSPIDESQMWNGFPQTESAGYSAAKKMGIVASMSYRTQYGLSSVVVIPGNMFGEYDNFRTEESHVIPAMIRRYYEAKRTDSKQIVMWGSGKPKRDFVYAGDVAAVFPYFIDEYDSSEPVNISTGATTSIRDLAEFIKGTTGFEGEIVWDTSKPDGQIEKIFDVKRLNQLGLSCKTSLRDGLSRTIDWFTRNYEDRIDGIRV